MNKNKWRLSGISIAVLAAVVGVSSVVDPFLMEAGKYSSLSGQKLF